MSAIQAKMASVDWGELPLAQVAHLRLQLDSSGQTGQMIETYAATSFALTQFDVRVE